jgi:RNA polymerase II subunit A small phosphatase-like protein
MLLILDLDETLVHARHEPLQIEPHFSVGPYAVYRRPFLNEFINFCRENFEVAVWTSSSEDYAVEIVKQVFGSDYPLSFVWARNRCTVGIDANEYAYQWGKNLRKVKKKGYSLERVLAIDDTPEKYRRNYGNLVRVKPFEGDFSDDELNRLIPYLLRLKDVPNVRKIEKRFWRTHDV